MKRNVDLTADNKFREDKSLEHKDKIARRAIRGALIEKWDREELVITGDKEERIGKRIELEFGAPIGVCDKCGKEIKFPWDRSGGLCRKCDEEVLIDFGLKGGVR